MERAHDVRHAGAPGIVFAERAQEAPGHRLAASALDAIVTFRPHVVVADLAMPGMDGYALVRAIAATVPHPPPVIAMSAYMDRWSEDEFRRAGFRSRLRKPFKSTDLLSALRR